MSRIFLAGALMLATTPALAQPSPLAPPPAAAPPSAPAPAASQPLTGPLLPGICLLSQQAVFANARVGVAASARIKQLSDQAQAEVDAEKEPLETDAKVLDAATKLKPADKATRAQALSVRLQALQQKAALRQREIEATRQKALARIVAEENPIIAQVYKAHACGLLFDRNSVLGGNLGGDLTADVVKGLDGRMTTMTFDRETLPPGK